MNMRRLHAMHANSGKRPRPFALAGSNPTLATMQQERESLIWTARAKQPVLASSSLGRATMRVELPLCLEQQLPHPLAGKHQHQICRRAARQESNA